MSRRPRTPPRRSLAQLALAPLLGVALLGGLLPSCTVHEHTVGLGPNNLGEISVKQYYLFWGLFRLNNVDPERLAENATSYRIRTETAFTDFLLAPLLYPLLVSTRTVTVSR